MKQCSAKTGNELPPRKTDKPLAYKRKVVTVSVVVVSLFSALGIYFFVGERGHIPPLPRVHIEKEEQSRALADLERRLRGYVPTPEERILQRKLAEIHRLEAQDNLSNSDKSQLAQLVGEFQAEARVFGGTDLERYLLLGDHLALQFHFSMKKMLKVLREREAEGQSWELFKDEVAWMGKSGGGFVRRAISRGALTIGGGLHAPEIAPMTVFRARWRHFAKVPLDYGFSEVEKAAYFDFVAAFAQPSSVDKRLAAINEVTRLSDSFDGVLARAIVLHEAGLSAQALEIIQQSQERGKNSSEMSSMAKALKSDI